MGGFYMRDDGTWPPPGAYGEQCADTYGLAMQGVSGLAALSQVARAQQGYLVSDGNETHCTSCGSVSHEAADCVAQHSAAAHRTALADVASLASRVADLETQLVGKDATIAGLRTEIERLSARHGAAGDPQTGASIPCETPRAFSYGWATNWRMR